jgi:hypothetical protein
MIVKRLDQSAVAALLEGQADAGYQVEAAPADPNPGALGCGRIHGENLLLCDGA